MQGLIEPIMAAKLELGDDPGITLQFVGQNALRVTMGCRHEQTHVDLDVFGYLYTPGSRAQFGELVKMMVKAILNKEKHNGR